MYLMDLDSNYYTSKLLNSVIRLTLSPKHRDSSAYASLYIIITKTITVINHINGFKTNHMFVSIDAEISFDKIQHAFMIKHMDNVGLVRTQ